MRGRSGRLLALEGVDGSGKSTLARALVDRWRAEGRTVGRWQEPTDPRVADEAASAADPWRGALLFTVDRSLHRPELESLLTQQDIVSDRSFYSTLAYQGSALPAARRKALTRLQHEIARRPDIVVLLDLSPDEALKRVGRRASGRSGFERAATLRRVAKAYRGMARRGRWIVLDATQSPESIVDRAVAALARRRFPRRPTAP